jgi:hypothetical protein
MAKCARRGSETPGDETRVGWSCMRTASAVPIACLRLVSSRKPMATIHAIWCRSLTGRAFVSACCLLLVLWPATVTSLAMAHQDPPVPAPAEERSEQLLPRPDAQWFSRITRERLAPDFVAGVPERLVRRRAACCMAGVVPPQPGERRGVEERLALPAPPPARLDLRTEFTTIALQRRGNRPVFLGSCPCPVGDLPLDH